MALHLLFAAAAAYWVYQDSQKRNMSIIWTVAILLAAILSLRTFFTSWGFVLLLYFLYRKPLNENKDKDEIVRICYSCGKKINEGDRYCPSCGKDTQHTK